MNRRTLGALLLLLLTVLPACGGGPSADDEPTKNHSTAVVVDDSHTATALRLHAPVRAHVAPDDGAAVMATFDMQTELGSPSTLLVVDMEGDWVEVLLPVRPNGTRGWVRRSAGELRTTEYRIDVDLDSRRVTLFDADRVVFSSDAAIGAPDTPTPVGRFYVTDLVETGDPQGSYGGHAIGLSGHSNDVTEFAGGDGQIGIHGTNQPSSIGRAVSHGCVRLPNDVVAELVRRVPLGTPVTIR